MKGDFPVPTAALTRSFMSCARCFAGDPPDLNLSPLWPPRGWAGPQRLRRPVLMVVSLNPGHPLSLAAKYGEQWDELALLKRHGLVVRTELDGGHLVARRRLKVTRGAAEDVLSVCWRSYISPTRARDHLFHRRSVAYARACLWLMNVEPAEWQHHCWFTDAVKCSTTVETNAGVPQHAIAECRQHLAREIRTMRPAVIAGLGVQATHAAAAALAEAQVSAKILGLLHPARWRKLTSERQAKSFRSYEGTEARSPQSDAFMTLLHQLQEELEAPPPS